MAGNETQADRDNEKRIIEAYCRYRDCLYMKLPQRCYGDYVTLDARDNILEYVEVKRRKCLPLAFKTINISLMKCLRVLEQAESSMVSFRVVYWFADNSLRMHEVTRADLTGKAVVWGMKEPRNSQEWEPCARLKSSEFVDITREIPPIDGISRAHWTTQLFEEKTPTER